MELFCKMPKFRLLLFGLFAVSAFRPVMAQGEQPICSPLFASDSILELNIAADFKTVNKEKLKDPSYVPANLWYLSQVGDTVSMDLKIKARGVFRKKYCTFPPLKLNFSKKQNENTIFQGQDKLKLVTHCRDQSFYQSYIFKEYLAYKMFNLLSDKSFKGRLVRINYSPTEKDQETLTKYAFLIEDQHAMADRNGSLLIGTSGIHPKYVDSYNYGLMAVFQYMIGNTDWNVPSQHNVKLLKSKDHNQTQLAVVPYDFDFGGIVNTTYSSPDQKLPITNVTQRYYRGYCLDQETYEKIRDVYNEKREALTQLYGDFNPLEEKERKRATKFLDRFYNVINSKYLFEREIIEKCRDDYY
ncbi:MAG: hypothetical protein ACR2MX_05410 [Cyclobacteriaceae bacterium]